MLEDGARHRAPMTGSSVTEQCERSDENVLISGDCGRADAIHGGRRELSWRTDARNKDVWTRCYCDDPRRGRSESWSRFGSDERRASRATRAGMRELSARLLSRCLLILPPCRCVASQSFYTPSCFLPFLLPSTASIHHVQAHSARFRV